MLYLHQLLFSLFFFTRLYIPIRVDFSAITLAACVWTYPLIGVLVGTLMAAVSVALTRLGCSPSVAAWGAIITQLLLTGGLHEDGLADSADGMAYGRDTAKKLDIMRDSRIGTFGVLALLCIISLRVNLIAAIRVDAAFALLISVSALSRSAMACLMAHEKQARSDGIAAQAGVVSKKNLVVCFILTGLIVFLLLGLVAAVAAAATVALMTLWIGNTARRHFGGITGDVLGATQLLTEAAALMVLVFPGISGS